MAVETFQHLETDDDLAAHLLYLSSPPGGHGCATKYAFTASVFFCDILFPLSY